MGHTVIAATDPDNEGVQHLIVHVIKLEPEALEQVRQVLKELLNGPQG